MTRGSPPRMKMRYTLSHRTAGPEVEVSLVPRACIAVVPGYPQAPPTVAPRVGEARTADSVLSGIPASGCGTLRRCDDASPLHALCRVGGAQEDRRRLSDHAGAAGRRAARDAQLWHDDPRFAGAVRLVAARRGVPTWRWKARGSTGNRSSTSWKPTSRCCSSMPSTSKRCPGARPRSRTRSGSRNCCNMGCYGPALFRRPRSGSYGS